MVAVPALGVEILALTWGKGHSRLTKSRHLVEWSHEGQQRSVLSFPGLQWFWWLGGWGLWILQNSSRMCFRLTFERELGVFKADLLSLLWSLHFLIIVSAFFFLFKIINYWDWFFPHEDLGGHSSPFSESSVKRTERGSEMFALVLNVSLSRAC